MSKYIDADALLKTFNDFPCLWVQYTIAGHPDKDIENLVGDVLKQAKETIIAEINEQPSADVVEVVRCENCKHAEIQDYVPPSCRYCCKYSALYHAKNFYCSMGERREDGV